MKKKRFLFLNKEIPYPYLLKPTPDKFYLSKYYEKLKIPSSIYKTLAKKSILEFSFQRVWVLYDLSRTILPPWPNNLQCYTSS